MKKMVQHTGTLGYPLATVPEATETDVYLCLSAKENAQAERTCLKEKRIPETVILNKEICFCQQLRY